ncbi:MAG: exonuclease domain-containing protein [Clostridia bacterium]|nr:exonuclease domain-containing protein [Clostridia bacterium]
MKYIVLDLEWNQTYQEKALAVQRELESRLRGEVIQIGAVMLDESKNICGSFRTTIKPRFYKKIHRHVMRLTGIDQKQLDHGASLRDAMSAFYRFCGDDAVFLTWGPDDIPMLCDNLRANRLEAPWLCRYYDMQPMFNFDTDGAQKKQRSLEYAMEYFSIEQTLPAHDALNDAYFTALVAQKLNLAEGVRRADEAKTDRLSLFVLGDADSGEKGFTDVKSVFLAPEIASPVCPLCQETLGNGDKLLHSKGQRYLRLYTCENDGEMFTEVRLTRNINETWRAKVSVYRATEEKITRYRDKLALEKEFARKNRRRNKKTPTVKE